jgi:integrase
VHKLAEARAIRAAAAKGKPKMDEYTDRRGHKCKRPLRALSATSINKTITRLGQILEVAVERELITRNPAKIGGNRRKANVDKPERGYLELPEQVEALLDAAGELDVAAKANGKIARQALLATLTFAGLRISEALDLEWRDVDLAAGRLRVRQAKTPAGRRHVDLLPVLRDELAALKATVDGGPRQLVFPSAVGTRQDRNRVRNRVLAGAIKGANEKLIDEGQPPLPEGLTLHSLRGTFCSALAVANNYGNLSYVQEQMGHSDPSVTYGVYSKPIRPEVRGRWRKLLGVDEHSDEPVEEAIAA